MYKLACLRYNINPFSAKFYALRNKYNSTRELYFAENSRIMQLYHIIILTDFFEFVNYLCINYKYIINIGITRYLLPHIISLKIKAKVGTAIYTFRL